MCLNIYPSSIAIAMLLLIITAINFSFVFILYQKKYKLNSEIKKVKSEFLDLVHSAQIEIQETTFKTIAREIHDNVGQRLSLARFYLNSIIEKNQTESQNEAASLIEESISDLKSLSRSLTANFIKEEGLSHALQLETKRISKLTELEINLSIIDESWYMDADDELLIFRIVQEALQNIIRHAACKRVDILLTYKLEYLELRVSDNGKGFIVEDWEKSDLGRNSGLSNMKNRATALNGSFHLESQPGAGTTIIVKVPSIEKNDSKHHS